MLARASMWVIAHVHAAGRCGGRPASSRVSPASCTCFVAPHASTHLHDTKHTHGLAHACVLHARPQVWYREDVERTEHEWKHVVSEQHICELEAAVEGVLQRGRATVERNYVQLADDMTAADFPLPTLGPLLAAILRDVTSGRGFALLKGLPVQRWSRLQSVLASYAIGLHWGRLRPQNKKAHIVGHVKDTGVDPEHKNPLTRIYQTRVAQPLHVDSVDLVGLLCLRPAKEGGLSSWSSSFAAHNEMLRDFPDLAKLLAEPIWYLDRKGELPKGMQPYFMIPIVNYHEGHLVIYLNDTYYQLAQRHPEVPRMSEQQVQALTKFVELLASDKLRVDYWLEPGDLQLLNNHCCIHTRSAFVDHEEPDLKRHLLRLWVCPSAELAWPLPECFAQQYGGRGGLGSNERGDRGGIQVEGFRECVPLEAE